MKRIIKRGAALLLATTMSLGMSTFVFAAGTPTITKITIKGVDVFGGANPTNDQITAANFQTSIQDAYDNTVVVDLTREALDDEVKGLLVLGGTTTSATVEKNPDETNLNSLTIAGAPDSLDDNADNGTDIAAVDPGTVIWIQDKDDGSSDIYLRIVINQANAGVVIDGEGKVKAEIVNVIVPMTLDFALDPMQSSYGLNPDNSKNQVSTESNYVLSNKTKSPVLVSFELEAILDNSVTLATNRHQVRPDDLEVGSSNKNVYLGIIGASGITSLSTNADLTYKPAVADIKYDAASLDDTNPIYAIVPFTLNNSKNLANASFLLGPSTIDPKYDTARGVTAFQLFAMLDTYNGTWKAGDISISGTYNLQVIRGADYNTGISGDKLAAQSMIKPDFPPAPTKRISATAFASSIDVATADAEAAKLALADKADNVAPTEEGAPELVYTLDATIETPFTATYQWFKDGVEMNPENEDGDDATLTFGIDYTYVDEISGDVDVEYDVQLAKESSGEYKVVITITDGAYTYPLVFSKTCTFAVKDASEAPEFATTLPGITAVAEDAQGVALTVATEPVSDGGTVSIAWYKTAFDEELDLETATALSNGNGITISGTNGETLTIGAMDGTGAPHTGKYYAVATNTRDGAFDSTAITSTYLITGTAPAAGFFSVTAGAVASANSLTSAAWDKNDGDLVIPFYFATLTDANVASATVTTPVGSNQATPVTADAYDINLANGTITLKADAAAGASGTASSSAFTTGKVITIKIGSGTYTLTLGTVTALSAS